MGFRVGLSSASALDTGGSGQRVVISGSGGVMGGGAVLLYPNTLSTPGSLEAGTDEGGPEVVLQAPVGASGSRSSIRLASGDPMSSDESFWLAMTGAGYIAPGAGKSLRLVPAASVRDAELQGTSFLAGWQVWVTTDQYEHLTFSRTPDGMVHVNGVCKYIGGTGATNNIITLSGPFIPHDKTPILNGSVQDVGRTFDVSSSTNKLSLRGAAPTAGQFISISGSYRGSDW